MRTGRPKIYSVPPAKSLVRFDPRLAALIREAARKEGMSKNSFITLTLARKVDRTELANPAQLTPPKLQSYIRPIGLQHESTKKLRQGVIKGYGGKCACCGESQSMFLTLDHINGNDGRKGHQLLRWIMRHNFPPQYRVLCFNCNLGRSLNGGPCPHDKLTK